MQNKLHAILKQYWGYDSFRSLQEDIMLSVLEGKDSLALLPTGGGKSLCFQIPALAKEGICIVVSPLIALMKDQVENLNNRGINAIALTSGLRKKEIDTLLDNCIYGKVKFLYVSPERLKQDLFIERFKRMNVNLIAIDEAHCVSQWGYDFRPSYLEIKKLKEYHPNVPFLALTATATKEVVEDIQIQLDFKSKNVFKKSFYRSNLQYVVIKEDDTLSAMLRVIKNVKGSGIVYVRTRRDTMEIARVLTSQRISATHYHAGLSIEERSKKQKDWQENKTRIIVSTNAFGMGIDKPDVRFVINLRAPDSLEAYFQEAGRAGRDERKAYGVLIIADKDKLDLSNRIDRQYPSKEIIKKTYYAVCNHLRIATGAGLELQCNIDYTEIGKSFGLKPIEVASSLQFLERAGYFSISDSINNSSTLKFLIDGNNLYSFQVRHKKYDPIIQLLLRTYGGLFDGAIRIKEKDIALRLKTNNNEVRKLLHELHELEVLEYNQVTNLPVLTFLQPRIEQKNIRIPKDIYENRKDLAIKKMNAAIDYAFNNTECRNVTLLSYFNDTTAKPCGKCDVCLANKKTVDLSDKEFLIIEAKIVSTLTAEKLSPRDLIEKLRKTYTKEEILFVLKWMLDNEQLKTDRLNLLSVY